MSEVLRKIDRFLELKSQIKNTFKLTDDIDPYGFVIRNSTDKRINCLISAVIHGDEIIGIEIINLLMEQILKKRIDPKINLGFLLCNIEATKNHKRFIEIDLNRCFGLNRTTKTEEKRAVEISKIIEKTDFVLDIHQTVEPTNSPFFIFEHNDKLIEIAHSLLPEIPIVTFPTVGFSNEGKTMLEYASSVNCSALAIECGEVGFSEKVSDKICKMTIGLISKIQDNDLEASILLNSLEVIHLKQTIINEEGSYLSPDLKNHMKVKKGQKIGFRKNGNTIISKHDGYLYFPRYGDLAISSPILCDIGIPTHYKKP